MLLQSACFSTAAQFTCTKQHAPAIAGVGRHLALICTHTTWCKNRYLHIFFAIFRILSPTSRWPHFRIMLLTGYLRLLCREQRTPSLESYCKRNTSSSTRHTHSSRSFHNPVLRVQRNNMRSKALEHLRVASCRHRRVLVQNYSSLYADEDHPQSSKPMKNFN